MQQISEMVNKNTFKNKKGEEKQGNLNAIPNNMEKYMAFMSGYNLVSIDSFQCMRSSLDKLVSSLPKEDFKYTSEIFKDKAPDLMSKKVVYPYDYMDSFDKFNQTTFPTKQQFYSQLNDEHISDEQYKHAQKKFGRVLISKLWEGSITVNGMQNFPPFFDNF